MDKNIVQVVKNTTSRTWTARCGGITVTAESRAAATQELKAALVLQKQYNTKREYRFTPSGIVFVLYYVDGWWYDIMSQDHAFPSSTYLGREVSYECALTLMERHHHDYDSTRKEEIDDGINQGA